ncbi:hypothetical protein Lepto7376_4102 [[Leptolyngbya] sp. PCC 7376]|uniref:TM2 domain-containing protein n=1 Tax=[Leptolyngbya] sp. PCC 7376 TaxID=111781 RepID=UPI00029F2877|nr:TM2 domain-containing protein [[Leptolyngbya] sp. PCC 7376]AFY40231.1 hypothetical protein Lepto7376_4102 [[Leptolyngbya] sp. PCC 7376]
MKNKNSAAILSFFLGGVGVHKFYLGETGWGIVYAIFFWTYIPTLAGLVEALLLLSMPQADFDKKYNSKTLIGYESRHLTNNPGDVPQVIVNINGEQAVSTEYRDKNRSTSNSPISPNTQYEAIAAEKIDRRILKLCLNKGEITLLDCFIEIENVPRSILEARLEHLVRSEFLQIDNRTSDGKIIYRLDN